jgi:hypothetical protein
MYLTRIYIIYFSSTPWIVVSCEYLVLIPYAASLVGLPQGRVNHHTTATVYLAHLRDIASSDQE